MTDLPPVPAPYVYNATVLYTHDGDTLIAEVDWGFRRYDDKTPVRLLGCNARELTAPGGTEARDNLAAILPAGTRVVLTSAKPDKFNPRWDCRVTYVGPDGTSHDLVTDLIADNWAAPWDGNGTAPVPPWPRP